MKDTPQEEEVKQQVKLARTSVRVAKEKAKTEPAVAAKAVIDHAKDKKEIARPRKLPKRQPTGPRKSCLTSVRRLITESQDRGLITGNLAINDEIGLKLEELAKHREHMVDGSRRLLITSLERLAKRAQGYADRFKAPSEPNLTARESRRLLAR